MKRQVLFVDDDIGALTLVGMMLERGGFDVLKAKDAEQALAVLELRCSPGNAGDNSDPVETGPIQCR